MRPAQDWQEFTRRLIEDETRNPDAEFDALAAHLVNSLNKFNVPQKEQDELMQVVGGTRGQIVGT